MGVAAAGYIVRIGAYQQRQHAKDLVEIGECRVALLEADGCLARGIMSASGHAKMQRTTLIACFPSTRPACGNMAFLRQWP
ncbi:hypothetical protein CO657_04820 [Rhizobium acidisoli]|uniref:Uncharacterized protein n=1 Tax=Rhizobium acidisoli TaxID=1538158 RepID=A0AAE5TZ99_9HYPH|nr:hypothetical protein CO657_04820 [Rhizobium acidisoli]